MKLSNKFISALAIPFALGGLMVSCEDTCNNCNCDAYKVDCIVSADSVNSPLGELYSEQVIVIKGSGLSTTTDVMLGDSANNMYSVPLNPTFVTDNNIIITLDCDANLISTDKIILLSSGGCRVEYAISKPVPSPSIKLFYSEFVPDGDTLRVYGSAFMQDLAAKDTLKLWFESEDGATVVPVSDFEIANNEQELLIPVPAGVANNSFLCLLNSHCVGGVAVKSPMRFRDTRNIFLDFDTDTTSAGDSHGSLAKMENAWEPTLYNANASTFDDILAKIGGFPKGCNNYYQAITNSENCKFANDGLIYLTPYISDPNRPKRNLLGQFENGYDISGLCLKFEVYIPESLPWYSHGYFVFSAYGSEDEGAMRDAAYGRNGVKPLNDDAQTAGMFSRDLTKNGVEDFEYQIDPTTQEMSCLYGNHAIPGAWFHMGQYEVNGENCDFQSVKSGYYTEHGWMTVCIPLTTGANGNFKYSISLRGIFTSDKAFFACGDLQASDFYNMLFHMDDDKGLQAKKGDLGSSMFLAVDNFRIVPEDGGGARFSKYDGVTASSKYPF